MKKIKNQISFKQKRFMFILVALLLMTMTCYYFIQIQPYIKPVGDVLRTFLLMFILAGFIYYLLNPLVLFINKYVNNKHKSAKIAFIVFVVFILFMLFLIIPMIVTQAIDLAKVLPELIDNTLTKLTQLGIMENEMAANILAKTSSTAPEFLASVLTEFIDMLSAMLSSFMNSVVYIVIAPVIALSIYGNEQKVFSKITDNISGKYRNITEKFVFDIDLNLRKYIGGQLIICLYVAVGMFIVYRALGIKYAFVLAVLAGLLDVVPYIGPWIALAPALIIALSINPLVAVLVVVGLMIVQMIESYVVYPKIMGKALEMPSLLVMVLVFLAGNYFGLLGMIVILPVSIIGKLVITYFIKIRKKDVSLMKQELAEEVSAES